MKIFLTGATGFVGAHTALALLDAGHELRLLVRDRDAAKAYFSKFHYLVDDFIVADMRDKTAIANGLQGCDALIHAAAFVSLDPKKAKEIYQCNVDSIDAVIGTAIEQGIKNIIYVSSLGALFNPEADVINESSPLGSPTEAYSKSKRDCDEYVRDLQQSGAPIQITYPSGIFGPDDPKLNESNHALITFIKTLIPKTTSGIQCVDVRDVAKVHQYLVENPMHENFESARYIIAGHYYTWEQFHHLIQSVTGRKIFSPYVPGKVFRALGAIMDVLKKIYPIDFPMTSESMAIITQWTYADSSKILKAMNGEFIAGEQTFHDTAQWLVRAGHLEAKYLQNK